MVSKPSNDECFVEMITIQKYFEKRPDGSETGRLLYLVNGEPPDAAPECVWSIDPFFKIDDEITHDPEKIKHYGKAFTDGFVVVEV